MLLCKSYDLLSMDDKKSLISKIKEFASALSDNIITLNKDISSLVSDTRQAYGGAKRSFKNVTNYVDQIKTAPEVFGKIDTALKMIDEESILINDLVNLLYSTSKAVGSSSQLIKPFSPEVSMRGKNVASQIEELASLIMTSGLATREIVKPLRTAMKQITSALIILNRDMNPELKKSLPLDQSIILDQAAAGQKELERSEQEFEKELEEWEIVNH